MPDSSIIERPGVLSAANQVATLGVSGYGGVAFQIQGTFTGTITFEASVHGQEFEPLRVVATDNSTAVTTATSTGIFVGSAVGITTVRARMSAYTNGAASVLIRADVASPGGSGGGGGAGSDVNLIEVGGASIALGQAAMAASLPVVIASNQSAIDVNITGGGGSGGTASNFAAAFPAAGTAIGIADPDGNMAPLSAETFDLDTGAGTVAVTALAIAIPASGGPLPVLGGHGTAAQALRVELPTDGTGVIATVGAVTAITDALPAGTNVIGHVIADTGSTTAVTGNVTVVQPTAASLNATVIGAGAAGTANAGVVTVQGIASMTPLLVTPAANSAVNVAQINGVTPLMGAGNTGTGSPRVTIATDQAVIPVGGNVAADAADSGNPVKIGGIAYSPDGTTPGTAVAELDRSNAKTDLDGRLFTNPNAATCKTVHLDGSSAYTDQALIADPGDGFQAVITNIIASTGAATALNFFLEEGSTKIFGPVYLEAVAGRGFCSGPIYLPCTASTAVTLTSSASIAQSFQVNYFVQAL